MNTIGFKQQHLQMPAIFEPMVQNVTNTTPEEILHEKGWMEALKCLNNYLSDTRPFVSSDHRNQMFASTIQKIKERYFDPI